MGTKKNTHVTPVQEQQEGSCWARAAVVPLEAIMRKETGKLVELSVFDFYDGVGHSFRKLPMFAWKWLGINGRLASRADYPDRPGDMPNYAMQAVYAGSKNYFANFQMASLDFNENEHQLINALYTTSPVVVTMEIANLGLEDYRGKPTYKTTCTPEDTHAMAVVGYTKKTLIIKNSWGKGWGEKGYLLWERGHDANCGMYDQAIHPIVTYHPSREQEKTE